MKKKPVVYDQDLPEYGSLMTVEEFKECVKDGGFIDYDGFGYPVKDGKMHRDADHPVWPSEMNKIPKDATHIMWFNR